MRIGLLISGSIFVAIAVLLLISLSMSGFRIDGGGVGDTLAQLFGALLPTIFFGVLGYQMLAAAKRLKSKEIRNDVEK